MTWWPTPNSMSDGSRRRAELKKISPGQEHHHEIRGRLKLAPVRLAAERDHVVPHLAGMVAQQPLPRGLVRRPFHRVQVRGHRRLGIDHDRLAAGQPDHQVGPLQAGFSGDARLLLEVTVVGHARHLDHAAELDLAPAAPGLRGPQGAHQVAGLGLERLLGPGHRAHLFHQPGIRGDAVFLHLVQGPVHPRQRVMDRAHQVVHRLAPAVQVRSGQLVKRLVVLPQRLGGE